MPQGYSKAINDSKNGEREEVFPARHPASLGNIDSFVKYTDDENSISRWYRLSRTRQMSTISGIATSDTQRFRGSRVGLSTTRRSNQLHAGVAHPDLDIQTRRPPLLHQMNIIEWFFLESEIPQRVIMMIIAVILTLALLNVGFAVVLVFTPDTITNPYLCRTDECRLLSKRVRERMNLSVNPCDDFYTFVCGSPDRKHLTEEEDQRWTLGFQGGRVRYDFQTSQSLGRLLKKTTKYPESLVLSMYQGCAHKKSREKRGLQPYYDVLKLTKLYDIKKSGVYTGSDVIDRIALLLSYSMDSSSVIKMGYYKHLATGKIATYLTPAVGQLLLGDGGVLRYGYKVYTGTIRETFTLAAELNVTAEELDVIPHDIVCMEMLLRYGFLVNENPVTAPIKDDPDLKGAICELGPTFAGNNPKANFGQAGSGAFDTDLLEKRAYELGNPNFEHDYNTAKNRFVWGNTQKDHKTDQRYLAAFKKLFQQSAPIRLMRYMQWRVMYNLALELNEDVLNTMIKVKRHVYLNDVGNCIHILFTWMPFLAPYRFLAQVPDNAVPEIEKEHDAMINRVHATYLRVLWHYNFTPYIEHTANSLQYPLNSEQIRNLTASFKTVTLQQYTKVQNVPSTSYNGTRFPHYPKLYENIEFKETEHVMNMMKMGRRMHQWNTNLAFSSVYFEIDEKYIWPLWIDRSRASYLFYAPTTVPTILIHLAMAVVEQPFFRTGLVASDASGAGFEFAGILENSIHPNYFRFAREPQIGLNRLLHAVQNIRQHYWEDFVFPTYLNESSKRILSWDVGWNWGSFKNRTQTTQDILARANLDQSRYHVLSLMTSEYLQENPREAKKLLPKLENYNAKQLFYITLVNRRCEDVGPLKRKHLYSNGPFPQQLTHNLALSNLDDFSDTFHCPLDSPMNPEPKIYYWDRNVNITGEDKDLWTTIKNVIKRDYGTAAAGMIKPPLSGRLSPSLTNQTENLDDLSDFGNNLQRAS